MPTRAPLALVAALALALVISGCSRPFAVRIETNGAALTGAQAERLTATTDISALASETSTDAVAMRATVLADLRTRGQLGTRAADLLTVGFPARTAAVPVLIESCKVDGVDAVVVVEAYGSAGGKLTHRRLWVFDATTGTVLRAASFR
jgi:hypothetical protein